MAEVIRVRRKNYAYLEVDADPGILMEMRDHFSFYVPGYKFMPKYRSGAWDGKINLIDMRTQEMYAGLYDKVVEFANSKGRNYGIQTEHNEYFGTIGSETPEDPDEIDDFIDGLNYHAGGKPIEPHDFQREAIHTGIQDKRKLFISPTASGKSLIIYSLMQWVLSREIDEMSHDTKLVIVVPTTSLVKQLYSDFADYSSAIDWNVEDACHMVYSGQDKKTDKPVIITTWQSLVKFPPNFFRSIHAVFGDEAHTFTAASLTKIMTKCVNASWRIGTTGTLDGSKVNDLVLEGLFGPKEYVTTTRKLMDEGKVSDLDIKVLLLKYPDEERKVFSKVKYHDEIKFINTYEARNIFIRNVALDLDGNTIVMFKEIEHGKKLYEMIKAKAHKKRKIFFVAGETAVDDREEIRRITESESNAIIIASIGVFSTGINIKNLHNIIFARPTKSQIKVLQSIGRALRIAANGIGATLYDIADDLSWRKRQNYTLKHSGERIRIYAKEKFKYKIYEIPIGKAA